MREELILTGGLGNQLFIVLEAFRYSVRTGSPVLLNSAEYLVAGRKDRPLLVDRLLPGLSQCMRVTDGMAARCRYWLHRMARKLGLLSYRPLGLPGDNATSAVLFPFVRTHGGYFQYFEGLDTDLQALAQLRQRFEPLSSGAESNALALHVRRGDYLLAQHKAHGTVPLDALVQEASRAINACGFEEITLFTDSPDQVDLRSLEPLNVPVRIDAGGDAVDVFRRMAGHGGIVGSNSSFSLWAGLLGEPRYFSIPSAWMKGVDSSCIGFPLVRRYPCILS